MKKKLLLVAMFAVVFAGCQQKKNDLIDIGVIIPLTGTSAGNASKFKQGFEMAVSEINQKNDSIAFRVLLEDSKSSPKDGYMAFKKLDSKGIKFFVAYGGQYILSYAPETNNTDKILFASSAPNSNLLHLTNRCFRIFPTVDMVTDKVRDYIQEKDYSRIAIVYLQNEAYSMYYEMIAKKIKDIGKEVVFVESYDPSCRDFKTIVSKISSLQVDFLYSAGSGEGSALLTKQLFNNPKTASIPVMGDMNYTNPDNLKIIGEIKSPIYTVETTISDTFFKNYCKLYKQSPNGFAVYGYVIPYILQEAFATLGKNASSDDIYNFIKTSTFHTAAGTISFDKVSMEPNLEIIVKTTLPK